MFYVNFCFMTNENIYLWDIQIHSLKLNFTSYILILLFFANFSPMVGQKFQLKIAARYEENDKILERISFIELHDSEESVQNEISSIKSDLELKGFLNTVLDTLILSDSLFTANFVMGERLERIRIYYNNTEGVSAIDLKNLLKPLSKEITDTYVEISFEEIEDLLNYIVAYYEDKGNSFTQVTLVDIAIDGELAIAHLKIKKSKKRNIDKVIVRGYEAFPKKYIRHDLNLKPNTLFNDEKLINASNAINSLSFVDEIKPPEVLFTDDSTYIYLYLKKKRSNKFDGVLGFSSKENSDGLEFNGYLDL